MWIRVNAYLLVISSILSSNLVDGTSHTTFTNQWAVKINGTEEIARKIATQYGFIYVAKILDDYFLFRHPRVLKRSLGKNKEHLMTLEMDSKVSWVQQQVARRRIKRELLFNDHKWPRMWYLNGGGVLDMKVLAAWNKGYTGQGVVVSILDDGIEKDHPDLKKNYDPLASYDVNDQDPDPQPRYDYTNENRHGTRCAGEVAAEANNGICSVGVAYDARIGGVRMLDGDVTDAVEAQSLNMRPQHIDIFSASWGPDDDGTTVDGPGPLARRAFEEGIQRGRRGLGSIFVWASGNGGKEGDGCNCDGYTNSIFTLSISSTTETGQVPWYSEACSSTLATTFSSGSNIEKQIVTTDLRKSCTESHTGTSASAPLAAGLAALVLQANPELTWRDLQYLVVLTAKPLSLQASDWAQNGVGRKVSHHFGYGLLDISAMVDLARNWTTVPEQHRCEIHSKQSPRIIPVDGHVESVLHSDGCSGRLNQVSYLEHVQAVVTLSSSRRGEVEITLTSPMGTRSVLLARRNKDISEDGFNAWAFMTTHSWGEPSQGNWKLEVKNGASIATLRTWSLVMHGTSAPPGPKMFLPRKSKGSNHFYNRDYYIFSSSSSPKLATATLVLSLLLSTLLSDVSRSSSFRS